MKPCKPVCRQEGFHEDALYEAEKPNAQTEQMLGRSQWDCAKGNSTVLHEQILHYDGTYNDWEKKNVVEETMEDVVLFLP